VYERLAAAVKMSCKSSGKCGKLLSSGKCFVLSGPEQLQSFPDIEVGFAHLQSPIVWKAPSYMYRKTMSSPTWCFGFDDNGNARETVLGTTWMINRNVIFDLAGRRLGVADARCPSFSQRPSPPKQRLDVASGGRPRAEDERWPSTQKLWDALPLSRTLAAVALFALAVLGLARVRRNLAVAQESAREITIAAASVGAQASPTRQRRSRARPGAGSEENLVSSSPVAGSSGGSSNRATGRVGGAQVAPKPVPVQVWLKTAGAGDGSAGLGTSAESSDSEHSGAAETSLRPLAA